MLLQRNFGILLFTALVQFIDVCWHSFMHSSSKILPQRFSHVDVWTLSGPLQHHGNFVFQSFCESFAAVDWDHCSFRLPNFSCQHNGFYLTLELS